MSDFYQEIIETGRQEGEKKGRQEECLKVAKLDTFKKHLQVRLQKPRD